MSNARRILVQIDLFWEQINFYIVRRGRAEEKHWPPNKNPKSSCEIECKILKRSLLYIVLSSFLRVILRTKTFRPQTHFHIMFTLLIVFSLCSTRKVVREYDNSLPSTQFPFSHNVYIINCVIFMLKSKSGRGVR